MTTWTKQDEIRFRELHDRRAKWHHEVRAPVMALAKQLSEAMQGGHDTNGLADWFMDNTKELRDALAPFDDGERMASQEMIK